MSDTNLLEAEILKLKLGKPLSLTLPLTTYLALFTTLPSEDGTGGVEVSGGGYARIVAADKFPDPTTGLVANSVLVDYGTAAAAWGTIVGVGLMTTSGVGTGQCISEGALTPPITVASGQPVSFPIGSLTLQQD